MEKRLTNRPIQGESKESGRWCEYLTQLISEMPNATIRLLDPLRLKTDKMACVECLEKTHNVFWGQIVWRESARHCIPLDEPGWVSEEIKKWMKRINLE